MDSTLERFFIILFLFILVIGAVLENICAKESELKSVVEYNIKIFLLRKSCASRHSSSLIDNPFIYSGNYKQKG